VTHAVLPSGNLVTTAYDPEYRKLSVTRSASDGQTDWAKISYAYDNEGNLTSVIAPNEQPGQSYAGKSTVSAYDERNRLMSVTDALGQYPGDPNHTTTFTYDTAGHKKTVTRANGQTVSYDYFDAMNRVTQQTVTQTPEPAAVTLYTYYTSGLLQTMQDPHLVGIHSTDTYSYTYDAVGRKQSVTYPADSGGFHRVEYFSYDTAGRLWTFQNRLAKVQTFTYDARNRMTGYSWNDSGLTPSVTFGYDVACRLKTISTPGIATISRNYFNDNLLSSETTTPSDNTARTVSYTYDADGNRATLQYPANAYSFTYSYTGRDQLKTIVDNNSATIATYWYDLNGNMTRRTPNNATTSTYSYDALDRVTNVTHSLAAGDTRTLDYGYDNVGNRKWVEREGSVGDAFGYDLNDQVMGTRLNIPNPDTTSVSQNITYDANGNRVAFAAYGPTDNYTTNNLNQYTQRNSTTATYDPTGNLTTGLDGSTYTYDSMNRLLTATKSGATETFKYDGLNRQVRRTPPNGVNIYNVYDGWELIGEYAALATVPTTAYVSGASGMVKNLTTNRYYYQDASCSTSHLADSTGHLLEWYRYDLQGTPVFYDATNNQILASVYGIRHLFTGQQWYSELGLYDLRNRYYSPDIGRFLQADPSGFNGDATNLYRYCGNNPLKGSDPNGLMAYRAEKGDALDIGYWGGDGTGTVGFDTTGRDASNSTIFSNPYYTDIQVMTIGAMPDFTGWDHGGSPTYNVHDGVSYPYADASGRGTFQTVGAESLTPSQEAQEGTGTAGWDTSQQAAVVAIDGAWGLAYYKGAYRELGGVTFKNPDGSYGYTIAWNDGNTWRSCSFGPTEINGVAGTDIWHIHVAAVSNNSYFSSNDVYNATRINGNIYMGDLGGFVYIHGPDPTAVPNSPIPYSGKRVAGPGFGPFGNW
jgi:RHS repeat-associated protein